MSLKGLHPCLTENLKHAEFRVALLLTRGYWAFQNALIPKYFSLLRLRDKWHFYPLWIVSGCSMGRVSHVKIGDGGDFQ